tara:strand:- start:4959 stop:5651 length:693 start_codon:yes stop_codon:yes gene_type:complete
MRDIKPFVSKIKKLLGKNKARPLLLVMFLIVMLSFCYKNQNKVQAVGNTLFEGFNKGKKSDEKKDNTVKPVGVAGDETTPVAGTATVVNGSVPEADNDKFRGKREGLFKRRRREQMEGDNDDEEEEEAFRGRRSGFLGKRLGFRGKKEGMEELEEEEDEEVTEEFRGRRSGFLGKRLGFLTKKSVGKGKNGFAGVRDEQEGGATGFTGFAGGCAASASQLGGEGFRGRRR